MTLVANGPAPSFAVDAREKSYKSESPPINDVERNRFKESLDKAIAKDERKPADKVSNSQKEPVAEVQKQSDDTAKVAVEEKKNQFSDSKKIIRNKTRKISTEKTEAVIDRGSENQDLASLIKRAGDTNLKTEISDKSSLSVKTERKGTSLKKGDNLSLIKSGDASEETSDETELSEFALINGDVRASESEEPLIGQNLENGSAAVLIPFPGNGETEILSGAETIKSSETVKSGSLKVESGSSKKGKDEQTLTVIDVRSGKSENIKSDIVTKTAAVSENIEQTAKESNQIVLGEQNVERATPDDLKSFESRFNNNKEVVLARELKDSGNEQIVKKASFILKDSNQGEIKLILKPESLGRVKIHLNMSENHLVGKIIVENSRVGQLFENNLSDLSRSFEEAGISSSSIEVSVGDGNKENGDQNQSFQNDQPFFSDRLKTLDEAVPATGRYTSESGHQRINLVV